MFKQDSAYMKMEISENLYKVKKEFHLMSNPNKFLQIWKEIFYTY